MRTRPNVTSPALAVVFAACLTVSATTASVPGAQSIRPASPLRLDGRIEDWAGVPRVTDPKTPTEFAFQNEKFEFAVDVKLAGAV